MRPELSLKTLLRAPFKTLLTSLLVAAATFGLFYRVAEYSVTRRETARALSFYRGVLALDNGVPDTSMLLFSRLPNSVEDSYYADSHPDPPGLTIEQTNTFTALPGVTSSDTRYMSGGVIRGLNRVRDYGEYVTKYDYTVRFVLEGTYSGYLSEMYGSSPMNRLLMDNCKILAGDMPVQDDENIPIITFAEEGKSFFWVRNMRAYFNLTNNPFGQNFVNELKVGERYLIIGRWNPRDVSENDGGIEIFVGDQETLDYCDSVISLAGKPENYLETEAFEKVKEILDITNQDIETFDIVYTSDILAIPRFNEQRMVIQEGRAITASDTDSCVVSALFMAVNGLKLGDELTVELCDKLLPQHAEMGATAVIHERYGKPVKTAKLKIAGVYEDVDPQYVRDGSAWWSYSPNTVFVSSNLLPIKPPADHEIKPGEFSVVVNDALMIQPFLAAARPLAEEMGLKLRFSDKGWMNIRESLNTSRSASLITAVTYVAAAAAALLLAAYLYIARQKKTYAIMRALGTPLKKAQNALILPLVAISILAIPIGGIAGTVYALGAIRKALERLAAVIEQYVPDYSLPYGTLVLFLICEVLFLSLISALFLRRLAKTPPLALLQGGAARVKKKVSTRKNPVAESPRPEITVNFSIATALPKHGGYGPARHTARYILRHMRRAGYRTAISVLLAALLTGATGFMAVTRLAYQEMFAQTVVTGTMANPPSNAVLAAQDSPLMNDYYFLGGFPTIIDGIPSGAGYTTTFTNDIERFLKSKYGHVTTYTIAYAEGFDASVFKTGDAVCLIGNSLTDLYGIKLGDDINLLSWERYSGISRMAENDKKAELTKKLLLAGKTFKVAGIINSEDQTRYVGGIPVSIYAPLSETAEEISPYGAYPFPIEYAEFTLANKEAPAALTEYLKQMAQLEHVYTETISYELNTTELDDIRRVRDMLTMLFPIAVAAAVLIGLIAPGLIITQSAKEAATLRVLGTTKRRARCMLALEQAALSVLGMIIAAFGLMAYEPGLFTRCGGTLALCGGLYLLGAVCASAFAAALVTRHKVLELLQVKE